MQVSNTSLASQRYAPWIFGYDAKNMLLQIALVSAIGCMHGRSVSAVECYTCTNTSSLPSCTTIMQCPIDSTCSSEYTTVQGTRFYTLGCRNIMACPIISTVASSGTSSIIGRQVVGANTSCSECCHSNHYQYCADDKSFNCAHVGSFIDICAEGSHIRPYCKRFCGFCNTVDGGWASWSEWGNCDVTCGNGTRTKSRTCTDPPPANGGNDCVGEKYIHEPCSKGLCPVHGGWSQWSPWGSCSESCDVGLQRRDRTCSNPYPARYGDHCFGSSRADRMCFPGACANGSWSSWNSWGQCDKSCDGGVRTRNRDCDNPAPSLTGLGCSGDTTEAESCNFSPCQGPVVFFAKDLSSIYQGSNAPLLFTTIVTNVGDGYNSSTGFFTAPANGTYTFNVQTCATYNHYADAGLIVNGVRVTNLVAYGDHGNSCRGFSVPVILNEGDEVQARTDTTTSSQSFYQNSNAINSFSGTLIQMQL